MSGHQWAEDYDFPDDEKYALWCWGEFYRTHQSVWRYSAYIDAGHPSRNWQHRGFSQRVCRFRARRAANRLGLRVRWRVFLPGGAYTEGPPVQVRVPGNAPRGARARADRVADLEYEARRGDMNDTVILPMGDDSDLDD